MCIPRLRCWQTASSAWTLGNASVRLQSVVLQVARLGKHYADAMAHAQIKSPDAYDKEAGLVARPASSF